MKTIAWREYRCLKRASITEGGAHALFKYEVANLVDGREIGMLVGSCNASIEAERLSITGACVPEVGDDVVLVAMTKAEFQEVRSDPPPAPPPMFTLNRHRRSTGPLTPAEQAIREIMVHVETLGASPHLTRAVLALQEAFEALADHQDSKVEVA